MSKKLLATVLAVVLVAAMAVPSFAQDSMLTSINGYPIVSYIMHDISVYTNCQHVWKDPAKVGNPRQVYIASESRYHWYQTYIYVCYRCSDYFYSDVDLGPVI